MCNWYECIACDDPALCSRNESSITTNTTDLPSWLSPECQAADIHNDLGLFGHYPLIDRKKGMYMQIVQAVIAGLNDTNYACLQATNLRLVAKPAVDAALGLHQAAAPSSDVAGVSPVESARSVPPTAYADTPPTYYGELHAALQGYLHGRAQECAPIS